MIIQTKTMFYTWISTVLMMLAVCVAPHCQAGEIEGVSVGIAPSNPYMRVYVLINFESQYGWLALPLGDALNQTLTAKGKLVASTFQYVDPIGLKSGPNMTHAQEFKPDVTLICRLKSLQRFISGGFGGLGEIACDLYSGASDTRIWSGTGAFEIGGGGAKQAMSVLAAKVVQHLNNLKLI